MSFLKLSRWMLSPQRTLTLSSFRSGNKIPGTEENRIKIGNVSKTVSSPPHPYLVPVLYMPDKPSNSLVHHLQWILKKDILGQDMFLIGFPGPLRRRVALQFAELTQREVEYVVLSRDTTENDLKQRREIVDGTAHYVDQSAVRAAVEGRLLILDGVEKVERNVLPVLNNLLENREMQLEDGRFLIAPERYDKLLVEHSQQELDEWKLVRVSEDFRVIALGLPVPHFKGNPLDPPFRSRFQARHVQVNFEEQLSRLSDTMDNISETDLRAFMSGCYTFISNESSNLGLPKFPIENVSTVVSVLNKFSKLPAEQAFEWIYPYTLLLSKESQASVSKTLEQFSIHPQNVKIEYRISENSAQMQNYAHTLEVSMKGHTFKSEVLGHADRFATTSYISNPYHEKVLANLLMTHSVHDFCIVGNRGCGKATLVKKFASLLNYPVEMVMLYNEMTARDLLQQRVTDEKGNTLWRSSQLVQAAVEGKLLVLDGLHRLHSSTFSVLQRLVQDRDMQLYDGTKLLRHDRYDAVKENLQLSDADMEERKVKRIHPSFRIAALAEPPKLQSTKDNWMNPELLSMFLFHSVRPLSLKEEKTVIQSMAQSISKKMNSILNFTHQLRNSEDDALKNVSASFSTRQLVRMARRLHSFPDESVFDLVTQSCLMNFLPPLTKQAVENVLERCSIESNNELSVSPKEIMTTDDGKLLIGNTSAPVYNAGSGKVKVPDILFYNSQEHITIMEAMLQDFLLGEHLLLVGNQGVGKNKITDRFLQLLNRPREYIQLHRDTTVQSLTQQPTVVDGRIVYEDSPLLRAVQHGRVLVVDEADKAPTHVTSILKALVVSGEMHLSDGRNIVYHSDARSIENEVVMHPDFRMIVLANRPGFPFLGNDFFATLGDIFSCHAVDNPSLESEITMLRQYGPNVPEYLLTKLAGLFGELRSMSDSGLISYPYSTREVVNIVKHLNKFPEEGMPYVLKNVFDFDSYSVELKETLDDVFRKHGIPTETQALQVRLAEKRGLPKLVLKPEWKFDLTQDVWNSKRNQLKSTDKKKLYVDRTTLDVIETRASVFTEQQNYCQLRLSSNNVPLDIAASNYSGTELVYVATANPVSLFAIDSLKKVLSVINLSEYFPSVRSGYRPQIQISPLDFGNEESVVLHESVTNQTFLLQPTKGFMSRIAISNLLEETISKISSTMYSRATSPCFKLYDGFPGGKKVILCDKRNAKVVFLNFEGNQVYHIDSPLGIDEISVLDENTLFLVAKQEGAFVADISDPENWKIRKLTVDSLGETANISVRMFQNSNSIDAKNSVLNMKEGAFMSNLEDFACIVSGSFLKDSSLGVMSFPRESAISAESEKACIFPDSCQIVRFLRSKDAKPVSDGPENGYLEVVDIGDNSYSYIEVESPHPVSSFASWIANTSQPYLLTAPFPGGKLVTADITGCIRKWEVHRPSLENSFHAWKKFAGLGNDQQLTIERENKNAASAPKHGKVDPKGDPHVGGNTWAGGTGGRDTAGLGGKGGPYRLDAGHNVFQVSDQEKANVPPEVLKAAREMAMNAYKEKLREIEMSEYDANLYDQFYSGVEKQVKSLRVILDGLQAKGKERQWMRHQTSGEFDDAKLIEGITGEKSIYKRRGEQNPEMGSPQEKPKLLRLVVDVSGSMYRFNGYDNRLDRELESLVLVMEAFDGYHDKFRYEVVGHSGEDFCIEFTKFDSPPKNRKERLNMIRNMHAHSQFCMSGDHTLEATQHAIKTLTKEDADEYFVVVMSDANFDRYGISPASFGKLLTSDPKVNAFSIFIGSLGDQAVMLSKKLPAGRAFMCLDSSNLTQILQRIFTSALLKD